MQCLSGYYHFTQTLPLPLLTLSALVLGSLLLKTRAFSAVIKLSRYWVAKGTVLLLESRTSRFKLTQLDGESVDEETVQNRQADRWEKRIKVKRFLMSALICTVIFENWKEKKALSRETIGTSLIRRTSAHHV